MTSVAARYAALVAANLVSGLLGFAGASVIAWKFGPGGLGATALAASLITYALTIATCGTEISAVKVGAAPRGALGTLASSVMLIRLSLAGVVYAGLIGLTLAVPRFHDVRALVWLFGLSVFTSAFDVSWLPQAIQRTNVFALSTASTQGLTLAFLVGSLALSADLRAVPLARVAAEACVAAALLTWMRRHVAPLSTPMPAPDAWSFLRSSAPIGGTQLLRGLALGSDLVLLGLFVGAEEIGVYAAAFRVFQLLLGLVTAYFVILLPRLAARKHDDDAMAEELEASFRRSLPPALLALTVLAASAGPLFRILFGEAFAGAATPLRVLLVSLVVNIGLRHHRQVLLVRGQERVDLRNSVAGAVVHVAAKVSLIPVMGAVGAAFGTLLGEAVLFVLQRRAARRAIAGQRIAPVDGSSR